MCTLEQKSQLLCKNQILMERLENTFSLNLILSRLRISTCAVKCEIYFVSYRHCFYGGMFRWAPRLWTWKCRSQSGSLIWFYFNFEDSSSQKLKTTNFWHFDDIGGRSWWYCDRRHVPRQRSSPLRQQAANSQATDLSGMSVFFPGKFPLIKIWIIQSFQKQEKTAVPGQLLLLVYHYFLLVDQVHVCH